jgi:septum site-determining protein MinD
MMTVEDVLEILAVPLLGVIPESKAILKASNVGTPVVLDEPSAASRAYEDAVSRLTGTQVEMRIQGERRPGLFQRLFKRAS